MVELVLIEAEQRKMFYFAPLVGDGMVTPLLLSKVESFQLFMLPRRNQSIKLQLHIQSDPVKSYTWDRTESKHEVWFVWRAGRNVVVFGVTDVFRITPLKQRSIWNMKWLLFDMTLDAKTKKHVFQHQQTQNSENSIVSLIKKPLAGIALKKR